jgi:hypothetical protein
MVIFNPQRRTCAASRRSFAPSRICTSSGLTRRVAVNKTPVAKPMTNEMGSWLFPASSGLGGRKTGQFAYRFDRKLGNGITGFSGASLLL